MAVEARRETYSHAMIDCGDMTVTEYNGDDIRSYKIADILKRWDQVPDVKITVSRSAELPADEDEG